MADTENKSVKKRNKGWDNLISQDMRTLEERQKIGQMGGIKSGESRRRMKTFKEELQALLAMDIEDANGNKINAQEKVNMALIVKATKGDVKAYEAIRDTLGQKPVEEKSVVVSAPLESRIEIIEEMNRRLYGDTKPKQDN